MPEAGAEEGSRSRPLLLGPFAARTRLGPRDPGRRALSRPGRAEPRLDPPKATCEEVTARPEEEVGRPGGPPSIGKWPRLSRLERDVTAMVSPVLGGGEGRCPGGLPAIAPASGTGGAPPLGPTRPGRGGRRRLGVSLPADRGRGSRAPFQPGAPGCPEGRLEPARGRDEKGGAAQVEESEG